MRPSPLPPLFRPLQLCALVLVLATASGCASWQAISSWRPRPGASPAAEPVAAAPEPDTVVVPRDDATADLPPGSADAPAPAEPVRFAKSPDGSVFLQPLAPVRRDIFTRSYRVGETYTARRGEPVVSVKNYSVTERVGRATALRDFVQDCRGLFSRESSPCQDAPLSKVRGSMGSVFDVVAAVTVPDGQYFAVALPVDGGTNAYLLVDPTGRLRRGPYVASRDVDSHGAALGRVPVRERTVDVPLDSTVPLFSFESVERFVFMGPGYLSFDLRFLGTGSGPRGETWSLLYREFGRDSTDMPAFEQVLQFPATQKEVEIARLRIRVESVGPEEVRFAVVEDSQPVPAGR